MDETVFLRHRVELSGGVWGEVRCVAGQWDRVIIRCYYSLFACDCSGRNAIERACLSVGIPRSCCRLLLNIQRRKRADGNYDWQMTARLELLRFCLNTANHRRPPANKCKLTQKRVACLQMYKVGWGLTAGFKH